MSGADRRAVLRLAAVSALAALGATRAFAAGTPADLFAPSSRPMRYTRRLVRSLGRDHRLLVERAFEVRFTPTATGFLVAGEQIAVTVEAPAALETHARLERERIEKGLFPLRLDAAGRIAGGVSRADPARIDEVLAATRSVLATRPLSAGERDEAERFLALVHSSAASFLSRLPADLFAPAAPRRVEERALELPGGEGTVRVEFVAETNPATGLMQRAHREIVTAVIGDTRSTREDWTLEPL